MAHPKHYTVAERFIRYAQIDTQSDPQSSSFPSTAKQKDLLRLLTDELSQMGAKDVEMDEWGYVYATIPATTTVSKPTICFCAHVDTAPDCSGSGVKPIIHQNYDGLPITLPDDHTQVITTDNHPYLKEKIGDDIITASGTTLLGADDKAGVAIIMDMARYLLENPDIKHGRIRILFTPDEEVGRGVEKLDIKKVDADYGYTLDGGELGSLESESFSADMMQLIFHGVSAHPGYAKDKMVNAIKLAAEFVDRLPKDQWSPETTEGRSGFVHPMAVNGNIEKAELTFIIRSFDTEELAVFEHRLKHIAEEVVAAHPGSLLECHVQEQYRNMMEVIRQYPHITDNAKEAMRKVGITTREHIIRGGTDGSRLSFMGLPCPNLFTGEMGIHSKQEYVSIQDMQKAVDMLVELVQL
jgi:peptidase T. Metallo peptidase. MEROPS family M20B